MHTAKFYPVGNGDCSQFILNNGKRLLFDFRHLEEGEKKGHPAIDLKKSLGDELEDAGKDYLDVVAFTHGDEDHFKGSTEFFELSHARKYQGRGRIKINTLWVPAAMILEEGLTGENQVLRAEARYRLKDGKGIRVFSKPDKLKAWLKGEGIRIEDRKHLISDAGTIIPEFTLQSDEVEFFVHAPFNEQVDGSEEISRNESALILHATLKTKAGTKRFLIVGDSEWETLEKIVSLTKSHSKKERLTWDLYNVPHHCSYLALSDEKGDKITEPKPNIRWLLDQGTEGAIIICSSNEIEDDYDRDQPPHIQAKNQYNQTLEDKNSGQMLVTMEHPDTKNPVPIEIIFDEDGCRLRPFNITAPAVALANNSAPRAGTYGC